MLGIAVERDGLTNTIWAIVVDQWRHDAAIGGAAANVFKMNVASGIAVVC